MIKLPFEYIKCPRTENNGAIHSLIITATQSSTNIVLDRIFGSNSTIANAFISLLIRLLSPHFVWCSLFFSVTWDENNNNNYCFMRLKYANQCKCFLSKVHWIWKYDNSNLNNEPHHQNVDEVERKGESVCVWKAQTKTQFKHLAVDLDPMSKIVISLGNKRRMLKYDLTISSVM